MPQHYETFEEVTKRLDEIVDQVKKKDSSLDRSLELFDEAVMLGNKAVDLVDSADVSSTEVEAKEQ